MGRGGRKRCCRDSGQRMAQASSLPAVSSVQAASTALASMPQNYDRQLIPAIQLCASTSKAWWHSMHCNVCHQMLTFQTRYERVLPSSRRQRRLWHEPPAARCGTGSAPGAAVQGRSRDRLRCTSVNGGFTPTCEASRTCGTSRRAGSGGRAAAAAGGPGGLCSKPKR